MSFDYSFDFSSVPSGGFDSEGMASNIGTAIFGIMFVVLGLVLAIAVVMYVFQSLGLYTIAKRRNISNYGLAWVPVVNMWIIGRLADQYDDARNGKNMKLRHVLLWVYIALYLIYIIFAVILFSWSFEIAGAAMIFGGDLPMDMLTSSMGTFAGVGILSTVVSILSIVGVVFYFMALYRIYRSCSPKSSTVLTVLSILFSVIIPFALFSLRNKDLGYVEINEERQKWHNQQD